MTSFQISELRIYSLQSSSPWVRVLGISHSAPLGYSNIFSVCIHHIFMPYFFLSYIKIFKILRSTFQSDFDDFQLKPYHYVF